MENKYSGNGIGELFQGKTSGKKANLQQAHDTPLRPGNQEHLEKNFLSEIGTVSVLEV